MDDTQRQVASLEEEPRRADPLRGEQVRELQGQLETLRAKMQQMETLERSFSETKRQLEVGGLSSFFFLTLFFSINPISAHAICSFSFLECKANILHD